MTRNSPTEKLNAASLSPAGTDEVLLSAVSKAAWRLLPVLTIAFIINFIDRNSVGFAALTMNHDLGITPTEFGFAAGILFAGYCLFEVPSNMVLYRVGARIWLARIMITWGIVAAATAFVTGPTSYYILRFLLGAFEAGFAPGVTFLLAAWFPAQYRTRILMFFFLAVPVSAVIAGPVSGFLLQMHQVGLKGWQWMFILEGVPACIVGLALLRLVTDLPSKAGWLSPHEREVLLAALAQEQRPGAKSTLFAALVDPRLILLTAVQFGFVLGTYGIGIWLPQILKQYGLSTIDIGFLSAVPYIVAALGMILWARLADRIGSSVTNLVIACFAGVLGLVFSVAYEELTPALIGLTVALTGVNAARALFWTIPARFLTGAAAAGGIAFINSIGALGGFVGPFMMGWLRTLTGSFTTGILTMGGILLLSTLLSMLLWPMMRQEK